MPVPAKIAFTILAIAVMVYALFLASMLTSSKQTQTVQTHAAYCTGRKPVCGKNRIAVCHGYWACVIGPTPYR